MLIILPDKKAYIKIDQWGSFKKLLSSDIWYSNISWNIIFNKILIQLFIKSLNLLERNVNSLKIIIRRSNMSSKIPRGIPRFLVKSSLNYFRGTIFEDSMNSDNYGLKPSEIFLAICIWMLWHMDWLYKNL